MTLDQPEAAGPDPVEAAFTKAQRYNDVGRHDDAERELCRALGDDPQNALLFCELARTRIGAERIEEAREPAEKAAALAPEWYLPFAFLAVIDTELGRHSAAERTVLEALRLEPEEPWCYDIYGRLLLRTGHLDKAERVLKRGLALDPDREGPHEMLALLHARRREAERSEMHGQQALTHAPEEDSSHAAMGISYYSTGRPFKARRYLREALRLNPSAELEELWLEVDKSCRWIYLPFYYWSLLIDRLPGKQFGIWGLFILFVTVAPKLGIPEEVRATVAITYIAFCIYTWFAGLLVRGWLKLLPPRL